MNQYKNLLQDVQQQIEEMQQGIAWRKQLESNAADVDAWLKKTNIELSESLQPNADTMAVTVMLNKYEVWMRFAQSVCKNFHLLQNGV